MTIVLDLFAGPGGWDEGVRPLGIRPLGIEWDRDACATGRAAGHWRLQTDVARMNLTELPRFTSVVGLIASPPCQGFSMAGKGRGRADTVHLLESLDRVRTLEDLEADLTELHATMTDDRSLLALEPLRYALALRPDWLAWEQVPAVLPLWEACAVILRAQGYSVATGKLSTEQYGVPQTRQRAILVARSAELTAQLGLTELPDPTHSRYYSRTPEKLDPGVLPWVSMAQALGWGMTARPSMTVTGGGTGSGGAEPFGNAARQGIEREQVAGRWVQRSNYSGPGKPGDTAAERGLGVRDLGVPSFALTSKGFHWTAAEGHVVMHAAGRTSPDTAGTVPRDPMTAPSATITGKGTAAWEYVNGTHEKAARRPADAPAPTVMFGARANTVKWQLATGTRPNATRRRIGEPSPALAFGNDAASHVWTPAGMTPDELPAMKRETADRRVTVEEAAVLQTFPADYPWQGTRTAQYRQVGDAVPPLLALHVVAAVLGVELGTLEAAA